MCRIKSAALVSTKSACIKGTSWTGSASMLCTAWQLMQNCGGIGVPAHACPLHSPVSAVVLQFFQAPPTHTHLVCSSGKVPPGEAKGHHPQNGKPCLLVAKQSGTVKGTCAKQRRFVLRPLRQASCCRRRRDALASRDASLTRSASQAAWRAVTKCKYEPYVEQIILSRPGPALRRLTSGS